MIISPAYASTAAHGADHNMFQDPTFWVGVAFCLTVFALVKLAGKAIAGVLQSRADKIAARLTEAADLRQQAEKTLADYTSRTNQAANTAEHALYQAKEQAEQLKETLQREFEEKLQNRENVANQRLDLAMQKAEEDVRNLATSIALETVERVLTEKLSGEAGQKLINDAIDTLPEIFDKRTA